MKYIVAILMTAIVFFFCSNTVIKAFYDPSDMQNNIYGIHIVNHSDLEDARNLVNSSGGDWGYVTVVITEEQRDKNVWQKFFDDARKYHLIPIVRVASKFENGNWKIPDVNEIDSWVNFFNSLNWVIENRYVIIGNEPNHSKEWGGKIDPEGYGNYLKTFSERLKNSNNDYFVLSAGLDQAAPNSKNTMDEKLFLERMIKVVPNFENLIDGWNTHSYPNPAFSGSQYATGRKSIKGYDWELALVKSLGVVKELPVFITETGWVRNKKNDKLISEKMRIAFTEVWAKDKKVVAVTPFILNYTQDPFYEFSWKDKDGAFFTIYNDIQEIPKTAGKPVQKIEGEVVFSFLNPFGFSNSLKKGYTLVRNTGQNIFDAYNITVVDENSKFKVENISATEITPFSNGLVTYSLRIPEEKGPFDIKLGMYVNDKKVDDVYQGKIISW